MRNWKKNTIYCYRCEGRYAKDSKWVLGFNAAKGTESPDFRKTSNIKEGDCPCCAMQGIQEPPLLERPFQAGTL